MNRIMRRNSQYFFTNQFTLLLFGVAACFLSLHPKNELNLSSENDNSEIIHITQDTLKQNILKNRVLKNDLKRVGKKEFKTPDN